MSRLPTHLRSPTLGGVQVSRQVLAGHQRERVLDAVGAAFGRDGYEQTSVDDLLATGKVGVGNFYSLFEGKEDCFLAAFDRIVERSRRRIAAAAEAGEDWAGRAYLGIGALLADLVAERLQAKLVLVEAQAAGPAAAGRYAALLDSALGWLAEGRRRHPPARDLPPSFELATISGLAFFLQECLLGSRRQGLEQLFGEVTMVVLEPIVGAAELRRLRATFGAAPVGPPLARVGKAQWAAPENVGRALKTMPAPTTTGPPARRPRITRAFLEEHRRRRYVDAAAELLHEFGREGSTVTNIVRLAGTARNSFYEVFRSAEDCIAFGIGLAVSELFATLDRQDGEGEWLVEVQDSISGFYGAVAAEPILAELFLIHSAASRVDHGRAAARSGAEHFTPVLGRGRAEAESRGQRPPPGLAEEYLSRAIVSLAMSRVGSGRAETLPHQSRRMAMLVAGYYLGFEEADRSLSRRSAEPAGLSLDA